MNAFVISNVMTLHENLYIALTLYPSPSPRTVTIYTWHGSWMLGPLDTATSRHKDYIQGIALSTVHGRSIISDIPKYVVNHLVTLGPERS